jgi:STE24 endopeptidase
VYFTFFVIEEEFGFNKMTWRLWLSDLIKAWLVALGAALPLLSGLFWFMDASGRYWWLYAFLFVAGFELLLVLVYPLWIAPLFNKFTPIADRALERQILALAAGAGFKPAGIYVMDGSRRSSHSNAYFTGLGKHRRIVIFDTLIELLPPAGVSAVLAHEMGHAAKRHVPKMLLASLLMLLGGFWLLSLALHYPPFFVAFGLDRPSYHAALVIFGFASGPLLYFISPLLAALSRSFEYEADRFAVRAVSGYLELRNALFALSRKNLSNFTPHPWYSFFHYSHPTLIERASAMKAYWEEARAATN